MPLSAAMVNVRELNIEEKKSKNEKRKEHRCMYKKSKLTTEAEWTKTDYCKVKYYGTSLYQTIYSIKKVIMVV